MDYVLIAVFLAACWIANRWAFARDVERAIAFENGGEK